MHKLAIRISVLTAGAAALLAVSTTGPVEATGRHKHHMHMAKHHRHWRHDGVATGYVAPAQPLDGYYSQPGPICPAIGKSFDCKIWPPPYEDDPDRKVRGH